MENKPSTPQEAIEISLLKNRNFMLLWSGQLVSWVGTEITNIALPLIVLAVTGSAFQAGSIAAVRGAVNALWAIPGGILLQTVGAALAFFADSLSYFVNAVSVFFINVALQRERTTF